MHLFFGVFFLPLQICHHKNRHLWVPINNAGKNSKFEVAEWFFQKRKKSVFHDFSSDLVTVFNLHRFVWIKRTNNCCVLHNTWKIWQWWLLMLKPLLYFNLQGYPRSLGVLQFLKFSDDLWGFFIPLYNSSPQPKITIKKLGNICFATFTFSFQIIQQDVRNNNKKLHRFSGKSKTRKKTPSPSTQKQNAFLLLFFEKKKRNIIGNTRLKKQSVGTCFHVSTWIFPVLFCCGRSYSPLSSFGRFMPYHPSRGPQPGGIMSNKVRVVSTKASFFDGFLKFHPPNKKTGSKVDPFLVGFFVVTDFLSLDFGLWMFFGAGMVDRPLWWVVFIPEWFM